MGARTGTERKLSFGTRVPYRAVQIGYKRGYACAYAHKVDCDRLAVTSPNIIHSFLEEINVSHKVNIF